MLLNRHVDRRQGTDKRSIGGAASRGTGDGPQNSVTAETPGTAFSAPLISGPTG